MSQLRGWRSIKGGKELCKGMFTCVLSLFPPLVSPRFFFLREFFSRPLLSERLEQAISYRVYMQTGSFHISLFEGTLQVDKIHVWFNIANVMHALPVSVYRQTYFTPKRVVASRFYMIPLRDFVPEWNSRPGTTTGVNSRRRCPYKNLKRRSLEMKLTCFVCGFCFRFLKLYAKQLCFALRRTHVIQCH